MWQVGWSVDGRLEGAEGWRANSRQIFVVANTRVHVGAAGGRGGFVIHRTADYVSAERRRRAERARGINVGQTLVCGTGGVVLRTHSVVDRHSLSLSPTHTHTRIHTHIYTQTPHTRRDNINTLASVCVCERTCVAFTSRRNRLLRAACGSAVQPIYNRFPPPMSCAARRHHHPSQPPRPTADRTVFL